MTIVLFSVIIITIYLSTSKDGIFSPGAAYALSFIPSSLLLLLYIEKWDVDLGLPTIFVIISGLLIFVITSMVVKKIKFAKLYAIKRAVSSYCSSLTTISGSSGIATWKYMFFIVFQFTTLIFLYQYIVSIVGVGSFAFVMNAIRQKTVAEYVDLPSWIGIMRSVSIVSGYIWIYLLLSNSFNKRDNLKIKIYLLINLCLSVTISLLLGGRGNLISIIVIGWSLYYTLSDTGTGKRNRKMRRRGYIYAAIIVIFGLVAFQSLGRFLGRELKYSNLDYFAVYLSAPIRNLDTFLKESEDAISAFQGVSKGLNTNQTLSSILNYVSVRFHMTELYQTRDLFTTFWPDRRINGYYLGNCYTVYASYLFDGGWLGVFIYTSLHAVCSQILYGFIKKDKDHGDNKNIQISLILYCQIWYYTVFSFFDHMFYFNVITIGFFRSIIYLIGIKWFLYRVSFGKRNI